MSNGEIVLLAWADYVGFMRCRGVPLDQIEDRMAYGLGWAVAGQVQTPFADLAPNPWGPMLEVRQVPVPSTKTRIDIWDDAPALHFYLCDSKTNDGESWDCCTRGFFKNALALFKEETGLDVAVEKLLGTMEFPITGKNMHTTSIGFLLKILGGKISGCSQAKKVKFFKILPRKIIDVHEEFLVKNNLI